jgi:MFS family permease
VSRISVGSWITHYPPLLWIRLSGELLTSLTASMIAPFLVLYLHEQLGGSVLLTMLVVGLQPLTDIVVTLAAGGVTDRFGRKPVMLAALSMQTAAMLGMAFASSLAVFACLYAMNGAGRSLFIPAGRAQIADSIGESRRAEAFALLNTAGYIGTTAGPLLGVLIYQRNPSLAFGCVAVSLATYALAIWKALPETAPPRTLHASEPGDAPGDRSSSSRYGQYRSVLTMMLLAMPISFFYAQTETNLQLHLKSSFPDYLSILAWIAATKGGLAILLQFWLVRRTQHLAINRLVLFSYLCFAAVSLGYGFLESVPLLLVLQLVFVLGESIGLTRLLTLVSLQAPPSLRGRYFSLYGMHWDISRSVGPSLGSLVLLSFGGEALFVMTACGLLLGAYGQYRFLGRMQKASPVIREGW